MKAFIDESARNGYLVCAVVVAMGDLEGVRKDLRSLRKPGASRIHMATESPQFRRQLLSAVAAMPLAARIYEVALAGRPERDARDDCLHAVVEDLISDGVTHAAFESCDQDRKTASSSQRRSARQEKGPNWPTCTSDRTRRNSSGYPTSLLGHTGPAATGAGELAR